MDCVLDLLGALGAAGSVAAAAYVGRQLQITIFNLKVDAMTEYLKHGRSGLHAVLFRFGRSKGVMKALRDYTDKIRNRREEPISWHTHVSDTPCPTYQCKSHFTVTIETNRQQKDIDEAYDRVIQAMCKDTKIQYDEYLTILGISKRDLENKWRNPG